MGRGFCKTLQSMSDTSIFARALQQVEDKMNGIAPSGPVYSGGISLGGGTSGAIYNTNSNLMTTTATSSGQQVTSSLPFKSANYSV